MEFIKFICLAIYTTASKKSIPLIGFINIVKRPPKIAEMNGIKEKKVNCCFKFSLLLDLIDHMLPERKNSKTEKYICAE